MRAGVETAKPAQVRGQVRGPPSVKSQSAKGLSGYSVAGIAYARRQITVGCTYDTGSRLNRR
jgi:hypothetical protein